MTLSNISNIHCNKKFEPGHDCRKKNLFLLIGDENSIGEADEELALVWEEEGLVNDSTPLENEPKVSLNAMTGSKGACTLKVQGYLKGKLVHILIDSGSTHNLLSQHLAKQMQLRLKLCTPITITVANGEKLSYTTTTGEIIWQIAEKEIEFNWRGGKVTLHQQCKPANVQIVNPEQISRPTLEEAYFLVQLTTIENSTDNNKLQQLPLAAKSLLSEFDDVFATPRGLPPVRSHDHCIPLKDDAKPVFSNPYRCSIAHREEIEKICKDMLQHGVISFSWNKEADSALAALKSIMTRTPVLALPDFSKPLIVETDACANGIGAVMMQDGRPIAYLKDINKFTKKWLSKLLGYDYSVVYKKGKENLAVDAFSRMYEKDNSCNAIHFVKPAWKEEIWQSLATDVKAQELIVGLTVDPNSVVGFTFIDEELKRNGKYYIGDGTELRKNICTAIHNQAEGGHSGIMTSIKKAERSYNNEKSTDRRRLGEFLVGGNQLMEADEEPTLHVLKAPPLREDSHHLSGAAQGIISTLLGKGKTSKKVRPYLRTEYRSTCVVVSITSRTTTRI
ncbi:hypothetical protein AgCh_027611 [Apium graveolens]